MRLTQVLLATSVALFACSNGVVNAAEADANVKILETTKKLPAKNDNDNSIFVQSMPFKLGNVTGTMVITIDKDSLKYVSEDSTSGSTDSSNVYDFEQLEKTNSSSGDEERLLPLLEFAGVHYAQYKLVDKATSWQKE
ncbi:hypothetical protein JM18_009529 [Phytophthora kernoviae]|uniref:RxLR effector protein n=1 Tax=Phytophthora kernoviae TaxID=325452 RepID=A0A8T0LL61_9STRA|nr:hypothetical protein JM16_009193 [Phytophthora kernoviae]KAG2503005.1 hypothetical protein JM18_009529 [Phytophthora kernoviae]